MSQITKNALAASLKKLLSKKELSKITITNITEECGVNRQTFYYHFKDIYDLLEWIFTNEVIEEIDNEKEEDIRKQVEVPNVEGLMIKEATKILKDLNLSIQIENELENLDKENTIVREQVPKKGIKVYEGTKVIIKI